MVSERLSIQSNIFFLAALIAEISLILARSFSRMLELGSERKRQQKAQVDVDETSPDYDDRSNRGYAQSQEYFTFGMPQPLPMNKRKLENWPR